MLVCLLCLIMQCVHTGRPAHSAATSHIDNDAYLQRFHEAYDNLASLSLQQHPGSATPHAESKPEARRHAVTSRASTIPAGRDSRVRSNAAVPISGTPSQNEPGQASASEERQHAAVAGSPWPSHVAAGWRTGPINQSGEQHRVNQ